MYSLNNNYIQLVARKNGNTAAKCVRLIESIYAASALLIFKPVYRIPGVPDCLT